MHTQSEKDSPCQGPWTILHTQKNKLIQGCCGSEHCTSVSREKNRWVVVGRTIENEIWKWQENYILLRAYRHINFRKRESQSNTNHLFCCIKISNHGSSMGLNPDTMLFSFFLFFAFSTSLYIKTPVQTEPDATPTIRFSLLYTFN